MAREWAVLAGAILLSGLVDWASASAEAAPARPNDRVVGGRFAAEGAWPFAAYLTNGEGMCGGSLIAPSHVLTAAHCTDLSSGQPAPAKAFQVRVGSIDAAQDGEVRGVRMVTRHPGYSPNTLTNDIAILALDAPVSAPPIRFPQEGSYDRSGGGVAVIGWGRTETGAPSALLREADLEVVETQVCDNAHAVIPALKRYGRAGATRLCAGLPQGGVDSCSGDSGGPLLRREGAHAVQIGIVSFGLEACGAKGAYGVYTRVSAYRDWIRLVVGGDTLAAPVGSTAVNDWRPALAAAAMQGSVRVRAIGPIGRRPGDLARYQIESPISGYLAVFDLDAAGRLVQLFPNARSRMAGATGHIAPGRALTFPGPRDGFALTTAPPFGEGALIVAVSPTPQARDALAADEEGLRPLSTPQAAAQRISVALTRPAHAIGGLAYSVIP